MAACFLCTIMGYLAMRWFNQRVYVSISSKKGVEFDEVPTEIATTKSAKCVTEPQKRAKKKKVKARSPSEKIVEAIPTFTPEREATAASVVEETQCVNSEDSLEHALPLPSFTPEITSLPQADEEEINSLPQAVEEEINSCEKEEEECKPSEEHVHDNSTAGPSADSETRSEPSADTEAFEGLSPNETMEEETSNLDPLESDEQEETTAEPGTDEEVKSELSAEDEFDLTEDQVWWDELWEANERLAPFNTTWEKSKRWSRGWSGQWSKKSHSKDDWMLPFDDVLKPPCDEKFSDGEKVYSPILTPDGQHLFTDGEGLFQLVCVEVNDAEPNDLPGPVVHSLD